MITEKKTFDKLKSCPRFQKCSINTCPLDSEIELRTELRGEERCPYTIKKRRRGQKGIRTQSPDSVLKVIPESNVKMLSKGNQKRWQAFHQKS